MKKLLLLFMSLFFLANVTNVTYGMENQKKQKVLTPDYQPMDMDISFEEEQKKLDNQLLKAIVKYNSTEVKTWLKAGANPNSKNSWLLPLSAAKEGYYKTFETMRGGKRPNLDVFKLLFAAGANPNDHAKSFSSPLRNIVLSYGDSGSDLIKLFLDNGANPNQYGDQGSTALHIAAERFQPKTVKMLLAAGADPTIKDAKGKTPLDRLAAAKISTNPYRNQYRNAKERALAIERSFYLVTSPEEVQGVIMPFFMSLKRRKAKKTLPSMPKDMRNMLKDYILQGIKNEKLEKARKDFPTIPVNELKEEIEASIIATFKGRPKALQYPYTKYN